MVLFTPILSLPHCNTVLQRSRLRSASSEFVNRDPSPVLDEKSVVTFEKSQSKSSFAFSCGKLQ